MSTNRNPNTRYKIAAQVTGLQKPAKTIQDARKIWVLNEQFSLMKMESSATILHTYGSETFVRRERICSFQTNMEIALQGKVIGFTYLHAEPLSQLLDALEANYGTNFPAALLVWAVTY